MQQNRRGNSGRGGKLGQLSTTSFNLVENSFAGQQNSAPMRQQLQQRTTYNLMEDLNVWGGTQQQILELVNLVYKENNRPIITMDDIEVVNEIISQLMRNGFNETIRFLQNAANRSWIWDQDIMEKGKTKIAREIVIQRTEETGIKGVGKCKFCNSSELVFSTRQLRSGDEPATIFISCVSCQRKWRN